VTEVACTSRGKDGPGYRRNSSMHFDGRGERGRELADRFDLCRREAGLLLDHPGGGERLQDGDTKRERETHTLPAGRSRTRVCVTSNVHNEQSLLRLGLPPWGRSDCVRGARVREVCVHRDPPPAAVTEATRMP
jgi:hypothetical protein